MPTAAATSNCAGAPTERATRPLTSHPPRSHHHRDRPEFPEITGQSFRNPHTLIKTSRWTITARDTQVHGGHIPYPRPGDDRFHEPPPSARTAMARSDPHLIENSDVRIRRINSAPRQSDWLAIYFRDDRQIDLRINARCKTASPLGVRAGGFFCEGAAKRVG